MIKMEDLTSKVKEELRRIDDEYIDSWLECQTACSKIINGKKYSFHSKPLKW